MSPKWGVRPDAETCAACGFDSRAWRVRDAVTLLGALGEWWRLATDGVDAAELNARPSPEVWSATEYGVHTSLVVAMLRIAVERILDEDGVVLPEPPPSPGASADDAPVTLDPAEVGADLAREAGAMVDVALAASPEAWGHEGRVDGDPVPAEAALFHAVHDVSHHLMDVGRGMAALGVGTPRHRGSVERINASDGGVPKHAVPRGSIGHAGLVGDRQADRKHHGRPFQALCLWSAEVIDEFASQGHPIGPGSAGENLTLSGLAWPELRPGVQVRVGSALAEVFYPAIPCAKQTRWFSDGDFGRLHHDRHPEWTRWYAWVREPGEVAPGDEVVVQP